MTDTPDDRNQPEQDENPQPSTGRGFNFGRTGRIVAVGASIAAAFLGGMLISHAIDDRDTDSEQAAFVTPEDGDASGMPGGRPAWHDDDGEMDRFDDDRYERGGDDRYEKDDRYERDDPYEDDDRDDDDYAVPPASTGSGNQSAPMQSGQS